MTASEYAALRGRSNAWVTLKIQAGMPVTRGGGRQGAEAEIDPALAIDWEIDRAKTAAAAAVPSQRERLSREQADRVALDNAERRRELLKVSQVRAVFLEAIRLNAAAIDGVAGRIANELAGIGEPGEIRARLLAHYRTARANFAQRLGQLVELPPPAAGGFPGGDAAAAADAGTVG